MSSPSEEESDASNEETHLGLPESQTNQMSASGMAGGMAPAADDVASLGSFPVLVGQHQHILEQQRLLNSLGRESLLGMQQLQPSLGGIDSLLFGSRLLESFPVVEPSSQNMLRGTFPLGLYDSHTLSNAGLGQSATRPEDLRILLNAQPQLFDSGISALQQGLSPSFQLQQQALNLQHNAQAIEAERQRRLNERLLLGGFPGGHLPTSTSFVPPSRLIPEIRSTSQEAGTSNNVLEIGGGYRRETNTISSSGNSAPSAIRKHDQGREEEVSISTQLSDLKKPSRPLTAYNIFFKHERLRLINEQSKTIPFAVMGKTVGAKWKQLNEEERRPYVEAAEQDKVRHRREKEEYNERKEVLLAAHHEKQMSSVGHAALSKYYEDHRSSRGLSKYADRGGDRKPSAKGDSSEESSV